MEVETITKYHSFDGKAFYNKEECEKYESLYLSDEQLEKLFSFFHNEKPEDKILKTNKEFDIPIKIKKYYFDYYRYYDGTMGIHLFSKTKKYYNKPPFLEEDEYTDNTYLGLLIKPNLDFLVKYEARDFYERVYQGERTYNIINFLEYYKTVKNESKNS